MIRYPLLIAIFILGLLRLDAQAPLNIEGHGFPYDSTGKLTGIFTNDFDSLLTVIELSSESADKTILILGAYLGNSRELSTRRLEEIGESRTSEGFFGREYLFSIQGQEIWIIGSAFVNEKSIKAFSNAFLRLEIIKNKKEESGYPIVILNGFARF